MAKRAGHMVGKLKAVLDWKNRPSSIFYLAIPLFLIGFGALGLQAWLQWRINGDWVYSMILAAGLALLVLGLWPAVRMHKQLYKPTTSSK